MERWARLMPKLFGIVMIAIQLIGVIPNYHCDTDQPLTCVWNIRKDPELPLRYGPVADVWLAWQVKLIDLLGTILKDLL